MLQGNGGIGIVSRFVISARRCVGVESMMACRDESYEKRNLQFSSLNPTQHFSLASLSQPKFDFLSGWSKTLNRIFLDLELAISPFGFGLRGALASVLSCLPACCLVTARAIGLIPR